MIQNDLMSQKDLIRDKDVQTEGQTHETGETSGRAMEIDEEKLEASKDAQIRAMKNLLIHKINALKEVSQHVHRSYLVLEGVEYKCAEDIALLSPLFSTWGPYMKFFDNLVTMLPQKKDPPKITITRSNESSL